MRVSRVLIVEERVFNTEEFEEEEFGRWMREE
jgi:hypothetical protein